MTDNRPYIVQYHEAIERGYIDIDGKQVRLVIGEKIRKVVDRLNDIRSIISHRR